jgi:hypothetical protein
MHDFRLPPRSRWNCALLDCYSAISSNPLPTFRDNLSLPSSRVKNLGTIGCPDTSVRNYHYSPRNSPEQRSSQIWKLIPTASLLNKSPFCYKTEIDPAVSSGYERYVKPYLRKLFSFEFMAMEDDPCWRNIKIGVPSITDERENHQFSSCLYRVMKFPLKLRNVSLMNPVRCTVFVN